jgi:hypothetical protein
MARKRIGTEPLTPAEKQARYRERKKALGLKRQETWTTHLTDRQKEIKKQWAEELKQEELKAARAEGRHLARQKDKSREHGRIDGICSAAAFFVSHDRRDIAQHLLAHFYITRERADAALQEDKRTRSVTLATLDKARAWEPPPPILK